MLGKSLSLRQRLSLGHICGSRMINKRDSCTTHFKIIESLMVKRSLRLTTSSLWSKSRLDSWSNGSDAENLDVQSIFMYFSYFHCETPRKNYILKLFRHFSWIKPLRQSFMETSRPPATRMEPAPSQQDVTSWPSPFLQDLGHQNNKLHMQKRCFFFF